MGPYSAALEPADALLLTGYIVTMLLIIAGFALSSSGFRALSILSVVAVAVTLLVTGGVYSAEQAKWNRQLDAQVKPHRGREAAERDARRRGRSHAAVQRRRRAAPRTRRRLTAGTGKKMQLVTVAWPAPPARN